MKSNLIIASLPPATISRSFLDSIFRVSLQKTGFSPAGAISLAFVSQAKMQKLNMQFANNNYATDVLSFSYPPQIDSAYEISGEVVICTTIASSQAKQSKTNLKSEIALLLAHGLIHLSGKDHQNKSAQASFDSLQSAIIEELSLKYRRMSW